MNDKTQRRLQKIESIIRGDDFSKTELLFFRILCKNMIGMLSDERAGNITLRAVISHLANEAFSIIAMYFYICVLFMMAFLFVGSSEGSGFFFGATIVMAVLHVLYSVKKNHIKYITFFKLIKLYIRSFF